MLFYSMNVPKKSEWNASRLSLPSPKINFIASKEKKNRAFWYSNDEIIKNNRRRKKINSFRSINLIFIFCFSSFECSWIFYFGWTRLIEIHYQWPTELNTMCWMQIQFVSSVFIWKFERNSIKSLNAWNFASPTLYLIVSSSLFCFH